MANPTMTSVSALENTIQSAADAYNNSETPTMSDSRFDAAMEQLLALAPDSEVLKAVGAPAMGAKVPLPFLLFSLDKVKPGTGALAKWAGRNAGPFVLSDKLDGVSALVVWRRPPGQKWQVSMFSRGNGVEGTDLSHLSHLLPKKPRILPKAPNADLFAVRGELIVPKAVFQPELASDARSLVSGLVNRKNLDDEAMKKLALVHFVAYEVVFPNLIKRDQLKLLTSCGLEIVPARVEESVTDDVLEAYYSQRLSLSKYEIDGIVIDSGSAHALPTSGNPTYAVAFKKELEQQGGDTTVLEVVWEASKDSKLIPRVRYEPVNVGGVLLKVATGINARFIEAQGTGPGARIHVIRSGSVVPKITRVIEAVAPQMPPVEFSWDANRVHALVVGDDEGVVCKRIVKFFVELGIENIKEGLVRRFYENGMTTLASYLEADEAKLLTMPGVNLTLASKLVNNIQAGIKGADPVKLLTASNCFGTGVGPVRLAAALNAFPDLLERDMSRREEVLSDLRGLDGFSSITAERKVVGFIAFSAFMAEHPQIVLSVPDEEIEQEQEEGLLGMVAVFTGFCEPVWEKAITSAGGRVTISVSSQTTIVVVKDLEVKESGKVSKARSLGIRVVDASTFAEEFGFE
jgi:DNA ligase (NAD+)